MLDILKVFNAQLSVQVVAPSVKILFLHGVFGVFGNFSLDVVKILAVDSKFFFIFFACHVSQTVSSNFAIFEYVIVALKLWDLIDPLKNRRGVPILEFLGFLTF